MGSLGLSKRHNNCEVLLTHSGLFQPSCSNNKVFLSLARVACSLWFGCCLIKSLTERLAFWQASIQISVEYLRVGYVCPSALFQPSCPNNREFHGLALVRLLFDQILDRAPGLSANC